MTNKEELEELEKGNLCPVTIVMDKFQGRYSGAKWLAFHLNPDEIPESIGGNDPDENIFFKDPLDQDFPVGKGSTPNEALEDLRKELIEYYKNWDNGK